MGWTAWQPRQTEQNQESTATTPIQLNKKESKLKKQEYRPGAQTENHYPAQTAPASANPTNPGLTAGELDHRRYNIMYAPNEEILIYCLLGVAAAIWIPVIWLTIKDVNKPG